MNKKQYNNVIENTLKHEQSAQTEDSLSAARAIFDNMGVALPQGDIKTVYETIKTDNYMGWKSCTMQEAQAAADQGVAAIGISEDRIVVLSANDEEHPVAQTASVMKLDENTSAYAVDGFEYYSYSYGTTTTVGVLTIFAANDGSSSSWSTSGHAFFSFKNTSHCPITVGGLTVFVGEEITFGTWGNQSAHKGIWYNLESYFINDCEAYGNRVSLSINITQEDIDRINDLIADNDTWAVLNNCSSFATRIWNEISTVTLSAGTPNTPTTLMSSIKSKTGYETLRAVQYNTNIGYVNNGVFVPVTVSTFARNSNIDILNTQNNPIEFIVPINFNPNSSSMEVWHAGEKKSDYNS